MSETIRIDPMSQVPIYQQIRDRIVESIAAGKLPHQTQLAPVRTLAAAFGINPATVVKAYDTLRHEGLVVTNRKSGSCIARDPWSHPPTPEFGSEWRERLVTLLSEARAHGVSEAEVLDHCRLIVETLPKGPES